MVRFLLRYGARLDSSSLADGYTPLHLASQKGAREIVDLLLEAGASANAVTSDGQTALTVGRRSGNAKVLEALRIATDSKVIEQEAAASNWKNGYEKREPEMMQESYHSDSEDGSKCIWFNIWTIS
jgi:ankyrin repeat protein